MKAKSLVIAVVVAMAALALAMICATFLAGPDNVPPPGADQANIETGKARPELAVGQLEVAAERHEVVTDSPGSTSFSHATSRPDASMSFRGVVQSSSGNPIAGALIRIGKEPSVREEWPETTTGADGAFTLGLPAAVAARGSPFSLLAVATGFSSSLRQGLEAPAVGVVDLGTIVLLRPASISGQVLGGGFPLPNATVEAEQVASLKAVKAGSGLRVSAKTDASGAFHLREVPPGMLRISVAAEGHVGSAVNRLVREQERVEDVVFKLSPGLPIQGTVIDASGAGVGGVKIDYESADLTWFTTTTTESGEFSVGPVPPTSKGRIWAKTATATVGPVPAQAGQRGIRIELSPRYSVAGRALDVRTGKPLPGTRVQLVTSKVAGTSDTDPPQPGAEVEQVGEVSACDEHGAFRLSARHRGWYRVVAYVQGAAPAMSQWVRLSPTASQNAAGVNVMLQAGCLVSGKVVDAEGTGIPEAIVSLVDTAGALKPTQTKTDSAGAFAFTDVRPDRHLLTAEAAAYVATKVAIEILDRTDRTDVAIVMARAAEVRGRVVAESTQSHWQWVVRVSEAQQVSGAQQISSQQQWHGVADRDGRFSIVGVAPGTHSIWAEAVVAGGQAKPANKSADGGLLGATEPVPITVVEGSVVDVDLVATHCEPARIFGLVMGGGSPISNAELVAVSSGPEMPGASPNSERYVHTRTSADGSYELWTTSGSVELVLRPGAAPPITKQLNLSPGAEVEASFTLGAASVAGRIVDHSHSPIQGALVRLVRQLGSSGRSVVTTKSEADGSFLFSYLDPGSYELVRGRMGVATMVKNFSLEAGQAKNLGDLVEEAPVSVTVQVLVPSTSSPGTYEPLAEGLAVVETTDGQALPQPGKGGTFVRELTVRDGLLTIDHLSAGHYQLRLRRPIAATWPLQITRSGSRNFEWNVGQETPKPKGNPN